eukprot:3010145-Amphidinium_carterae.1
MNSYRAGDVRYDPTIQSKTTAPSSLNISIMYFYVHYEHDPDSNFRQPTSMTCLLVDLHC